MVTEAVRRPAPVGELVRQLVTRAARRAVLGEELGTPLVKRAVRRAVCLLLGAGRLPLGAARLPLALWSYLFADLIQACFLAR
jgi:hypothetical protein